MKLKTLNNSKWLKISIIIIIIALISIVYFKTSEAKYQVGKTYEDIVTGTVINTNGDLNIVAIYQEQDDGNYEKVTEVPKKGYNLSSDSNCTIKGEPTNYITYEYKKGSIYVNDLSKTGTKCNFYFKKTTGEQDNPYLIDSINDLVDLATSVNGGEKYENKYFKLTRDLDFQSDDSYTDLSIKSAQISGDGFIPIGYNSTYSQTFIFSGNFDGNNHRIDNLYINNSKEYYNVGLFGIIENSTIENLTISGEISATISSNLGSIAGIAYNSVLNNIISEVNISSTNNDWTIGGIIADPDTIVTITNCINKGNLKNAGNVGGLVGHNYASLTIKNSHNEGQLANDDSGQATGGIIGGNEDTALVDNVFNNGSITINSTKSFNAGGILGINKNTGTFNITNAFNTGTIENKNLLYTKNADLVIGGIVGHSESSALNIITSSYNTGQLMGGSKVGGIIGFTRYGTYILDKVYNTGNISADVIAGGYATTAGGISGYSYFPNYILNSYNTGSILSIKQSAGGIAGVRNSGDGQAFIINSYNIGQVIVTDTAVHPAVGITYSSLPQITINNVYDAGNITGKDKFAIFRASSNSTNFITNAYYLNSLTASNQEINATALTDNQLKNIDKIGDKQFTDILNENIDTIDLNTIDSNLNGYSLVEWKTGPNGYPILNY